MNHCEWCCRGNESLWVMLSMHQESIHGHNWPDLMHTNSIGYTHRLSKSLILQHLIMIKHSSDLFLLSVWYWSECLWHWRTPSNINSVFYYIYETQVVVTKWEHISSTLQCFVQQFSFFGASRLYMTDIKQFGKKSLALKSTYVGLSWHDIYWKKGSNNFSSLGLLKLTRVVNHLYPAHPGFHFGAMG